MKKLKSDLRRMSRNGLGCKLTNAPEAFDDFYYNMYLPYIIKAHGRSARTMPYKFMRERLDTSLLVLITRDDEIIAGNLIAYPKAGPLLWTVGVRDGNPTYLECGVLGAAYHHSIKHIEEQGYTILSVGRSRGFLRDGALHYKRKWGTRIIKPGSNVYALNVLADTKAARAFLVNNPFTFVNDGPMNAAVFVDSEDPVPPKDLKAFDREYLYPGLSKVCVYFIGESDARARTEIPPELTERMILRAAPGIAQD